MNCLVLTKSTRYDIFKLVKYQFKNVQTKQIIRNFNCMAQKVNQSKSYVAINIRNSNFQPFFRCCKSKANAENTSKNSAYWRLLLLASPEKWNLAGAMGFLLVSSTVTMAIPFSLGKVLDIIYTGSNSLEETRQKLNSLCGILLGIFVIGAICNFARIYLISSSGYRMTQRLRQNVFDSILRQEQGWFDKRSTGELVNRLSSDTQIVGQSLSNNISDGLRSLVMITGGTGMMFYMSGELALVGLAIVPPIAGIAVIYGRFVRGITKRVQDSLADATKVAEERIANIRTVKTFAQEYREMTSYESAIRDILTLAYKEVKARALFYGMTGFSGNIIIISVLYYGGVMVSSNTISVGNLSSFLLYAAYIGVSVGGLSSFYSDFNKSLGATTRIWEIMDRQPVIPLTGFTPLELPEGHIEFRDIKFSYPAREEVDIFHGLNLEIFPGQMVAVVGGSGSGKSTLAALLLRLYDPKDGMVMLDGHNVKDLHPFWLKKQIGTVSQEPVLFSCSIKANILYGAEEPELISDETLHRVAREANVLEFVENLPHKFDTVVGERGVMLSGGQKQRVAIARALIKNPKILLLDEATSALDAHSEHLVQDALEKVMQGRTVLTIAHRLSTIQKADVIAVLKNGVIVEKGTYSSLMSEESGAFRELVKHQTFQNET